MKLDSLRPCDDLVVVAGGDHEVVGAGGNSGEGGSAVGVGAQRAGSVGLDGGDNLLTVGGAIGAGEAERFVCGRVGWNGDGASDGIAEARAQKDIRMRGEWARLAGLRWQS